MGIILAYILAFIICIFIMGTGVSLLISIFIGFEGFLERLLTATHYSGILLLILILINKFKIIKLK